MLFALYRLGYKGKMTGHGFRAVASTILNESGFNADVIERQLAHCERNEVRGAYNRAEYPNRHRFAPVRVGFVLRSKNTVCGVPSLRRIRRACSCTAVMFEVIAQLTSLINLLNGRVKTQIPIGRYLYESLR